MAWPPGDCKRRHGHAVARPWEEAWQGRGGLGGVVAGGDDGESAVAVEDG